MPDDATIAVYQRRAQDWVAARNRQGDEHVAWVERHRAAGPVIDVGCGPGWNLTALSSPKIGLDATPAMLTLVGQREPGALRLLASAERLPVARGSLGGAVCNRVYLHLPRVAVPLALADLHRALVPGAPAFVQVLGQREGRDLRARGEFAGRLFSSWSTGDFERLCLGAGFEVENVDRAGSADEVDEATAADDALVDRRVRLRRAVTLPDTVGPDMRLLICGLNPSPYSADVGVGFGRPGNRFWPAARSAGLVTTAANDAFAALALDGIGMTDLVKRPTRRADELSTEEYRRGLDRVEALVAWLEPRAICFVGLAGWRAAVDRRAVAGRQDRRIGGRPVYLMPSTSGLNANATPATLADHLRAAAALADRPD